MAEGLRTDSIYLSLIIPAYNEELRIAGSLKRVLEFLEAQSYSSEVIIVDDGSQDRTVEVVRKISQGKDRVKILQNGKNLGKGGAVQSGMLQAKGEYLFFSDADLSVPIEMIGRLLTKLEKGSDIVIGSRAKPEAVVEIHQPFYREFMGRIFTRLSNWILGLSVSDFTCGFKGFRREVARDLFSRQRLKNWSFDSETLYLSQVKGYRILEIPVTWCNDRATKVRLWRDIITSFLGLLRIRLNHYLGRYG